MDLIHHSGVVTVEDTVAFKLELPLAVVFSIPRFAYRGRVWRRLLDYNRYEFPSWCRLWLSCRLGDGLLSWYLNNPIYVNNLLLDLYLRLRGRCWIPVYNLFDWSVNINCLFHRLLNVDNLFLWLRVLLDINRLFDYFLDYPINRLINVNYLFLNYFLLHFLDLLLVHDLRRSLLWVSDIESFSLVALSFHPNILFVAWSHSFINDVQKLSITKESLVLSIKQSEEHDTESVANLNVKESHHVDELV